MNSSRISHEPKDRAEEVEDDRTQIEEEVRTLEETDILEKVGLLKSTHKALQDLCPQEPITA